MTEPSAAAPASTIERSPADVLRLVVALAILVVVLVVEEVFGRAIATFASELLDGLDAFPAWFLTTVVVATRLGVVVIFGGGLVWALLHRRFRLLLTVFAAAGVAVALFALLDDLLRHTLEPILVGMDTLLPIIDDEDFPSGVGLTASAAILTAAAPWLGRRSRRAGWALMVGLALSRFVSAPVSFDTALALGVGWVAGAGMLVALGAPTRRATRADVEAGLRAVGVDLAELEPAAVDARGSTPYFGELADGTRLFVKVLGEDERSADLLFRLFRRLQPRDLGDERPFSSLRRTVEHEALVSLAARDMGVRTPRLAGFAEVEPHSFVLAYEAIEGRSIDRLEVAEVTEAVVAGVWEQVRILRGHRVAHRDLRLANLFLDDAGQVWLIDFGFSELAASDVLMATDLAELLTSMATVVGVDASLAAGRDAVGAEALATAEPRLARFALSGATRTAVKADPALLDRLRAGVGAAG